MQLKHPSLTEHANGHEGMCFYVQSLFLEERTGISVSAVDLLIYVIKRFC